MIAAILSMVALSMVAFTLLGLIQRWSVRLSVAYAGTMTIFLAVIAGAATAFSSAVGS